MDRLEGYLSGKTQFRNIKHSLSGIRLCLYRRDKTDVSTTLLQG
jgi:hypothetical protein